MEKSIVKAIENQPFIERTAEPVHEAVSRALERAPLVRKALHGDWLGHSLHAALTDIPVGAWTTGVLLDIRAAGDRKYRRSADAVHTIGLVSSLGAALAGIADWTYVRGDAKRLGFVHGVANVVIAGLFTGSVIARAKKERTVGVALSSIGYALALGSAWLGRELTYSAGANVHVNNAPEPKTIRERLEE